MSTKESNCYLYKIIDKDELVYIGKSTNIDCRFETHPILLQCFPDADYFMCRGESYKNPRVYVTNIKNEYWLSLYEITLISKYHPKYNKGDKYISDDFIKLPELIWIPYISIEDAMGLYCMKTGKDISPESVGSPIRRWKLLNEGIKC